MPPLNGQLSAPAAPFIAIGQLSGPLVLLHVHAQADADRRGDRLKMLQLHNYQENYQGNCRPACRGGTFALCAAGACRTHSRATNGFADSATNGLPDSLTPWFSTVPDSSDSSARYSASRALTRTRAQGLKFGNRLSGGSNDAGHRPGGGSKVWAPSGHRTAHGPIRRVFSQPAKSWKGWRLSKPLRSALCGDVRLRSNEGGAARGLRVRRPECDLRPVALQVQDGAIWAKFGEVK